MNTINVTGIGRLEVKTTQAFVELAGAIRRAIEAVTRERSGVHDHTERH